MVKGGEKKRRSSVRAKAGMKWKERSSRRRRMGAHGGRTRDVSIFLGEGC
jgi:hypothetical protein